LSDKGGDGGTRASRLARDHEGILASNEMGELPSVNAAAGIVKAPHFDRMKRLLEKHASSFTASQKAELREMLGKGRARTQATQPMIEGYRPGGVLVQPRPLHLGHVFCLSPPCCGTSPLPLQSGRLLFAGWSAWAPATASSWSTLTCA